MKNKNSTTCTNKTIFEALAEDDTLTLGMLVINIIAALIEVGFAVWFTIVLIKAIVTGADTLPAGVFLLPPACIMTFLTSVVLRRYLQIRAHNKEK